MAYVLVVKILSFHGFQDMHQIFEDTLSFVVEKGTNKGLFEVGGLSSEHGDWLAELGLISGSFIVDLRVIEIFIEDNTNDDLVVLYGDSSKFLVLSTF